MRIAIAQMNSRPGDFSRTASRMVEHARAAAARGAELVVFPVPVLTGPDPWSRGENEGYLEDLSACMGRLARELACPALVPLVLTPPGGPFCEAVLVADGQATPLRLSAQRQVGGHLERADVGSHDFVPVGFTLGGLRFAVAFDQDELAYVCESGVPLDVVCYLESGCFCTDDETTALAPSVADGGFVADAAHANAWIVAAGAVGAYEAQVFCGGSFVMAPWGELAWAGPSFEEALGVAEVDPLFEGPLAAPAKPVPYQRMDHLWGALALAIHDYADKQGVADAVVPLSGDLCTSAVASLATDALGPMHVHAVIFGAQDAAALEDARATARALRVQATELPDGALLSAAAALGLAVPSSSADAPSARWELACAALRLIAGRTGALVLSAADKTALALDAGASHVVGCDLAPLGDVYRSDVRALMQRRAAVSSAVGASSLARLSLPAVLEGLGAPGEDLLSRADACLLMLVERRLSLGEAIGEGADAELAGRVAAALDDNERVRRSVGCYPMMSERALFERRVQLGSAWHDHVRPGPQASSDPLLAMLTVTPAPGAEPMRGPAPLPAQELSDETSRRVEGLLGMLQDMLQDGSWPRDGLLGDGLFSEN